MIFEFASDRYSAFCRINFFGDTINLVNFIGCCVVFMGVVLYKVVHHLAKEEEKATNIVAIAKSESDDVEDVGHPKRREFIRVSHDESESEEAGLNGFTDEDDSGKWVGIEMRRKKSLTSNGDALVREDSDSKIL